MTKTDAEIRYRKCFDAWNASEFAYALELVRDLLGRYPDHHSGRLLQGVMLYELARYDEAEAKLRQTLNDFPQEGLDHLYVHLGHLFQARGDYELAEEHFRVAIQLAPDHAGRHIFLGALLAIKGRLDEAEAVHRQATRCAKGDIDEAYLNLGYVLRAQERYDEALECFEKSLSLTPDFEQALTAKNDLTKAMNFITNEA